MTALPHFGRGRRNAVIAATQLTEATEIFLSTVEESISSVVSSSDTRETKLQVDLQNIDTSLEQIAADMGLIMEQMEETTNAA